MRQEMMGEAGYRGPYLVKEYDWNGNLEEYCYKEILNLGYTFNHTPIEENVSPRSNVEFLVLTCAL